MHSMDLGKFTEGMMPKDPRFASKYPTYDGRGVVVAIFDTGCDPAAPGCGTTTDGKPKFLDFVDSTGSGDVDMSIEVTPNDANEITGLSGRTLKLGKFENPSGKYRVGLKAAYELFPGPLVSRLKASRAAIRSKMEAEQEAALLLEIASLTKGSAAHDETSAKLKSLKDIIATVEDVGPILDCVAFHDGTHWRAVIDCKEDGDLLSVKAMAAYKHEFEFGTFSDESQLNYSFNFYEEGDVLSIVVAAGSHGTHVAGIVGAYFPEDPDRCGNAPGCQMISVKIGDTALGTMETGPGLLRGVIAAAEAGCDLVNMSYGEKTSSPNTGRFVEYAQSLVRKHGMVFVSSAGNAGPCLTTVGSPGGNEEYLVGVGAFVLPSMSSTQYGLATPIPAPGLNYQWSSRGPAADGALGVSISACGGAYAPVPNWTLSHSQQMNGTSMSSPAACGLIALLVSGLKQSGIKYSPARIKATIEATARKVKVSAPTALGAGVLDIFAAFASLVESKDETALDLFYRVAVTNTTVPSANNTLPARGIYIRDVGLAAQGPLSYSVAVTAEFPQWLDDTPGIAPGSQSKGPKPHLASFCTDDKVNLLSYVTLESSDKSGAVVPAPFMVLPHVGSRFQVKIDASKLAPGLHYSTITARLAGNPSDESMRDPATMARLAALPALFTVPVTIVIPEPAPAAPAEHTVAAAVAAAAPGSISPTRYSFPSTVLRHTEIFSKFFEVPAAATWAQITVKATKCDAAYRYFLQGQQILPQQPLPQFSLDRVIQLRQGQEQVFVTRLVGGVTWELCLAPEWASVAPLTIDLAVEFFGVSINGLNNNISGAVLAYGASVAALPLTVSVPAPLSALPVSVAAEFKHLERAVFPSAASIAPLSQRDTFAGSSGTYELLLTYHIALNAAVTVVPRVPALNGVLYEAPFDAQMVRVYDDANAIVFTGDAWPSARGFTTTADGKYRVVVCVRHESRASLDRVSATALVLDVTLPAPAKAAAYLTRMDAIFGTGANAAFPHLGSGAVGTAFLAAPAVPDMARPGDVLMGDISVVTKTVKAAQSTAASPAPESVGTVSVAYTVPRSGSDKPAEVGTCAAAKLSDCDVAVAAVCGASPVAAAEKSAAEVSPAEAAQHQLDMTLAYLRSAIASSKTAAAWAISTALPPLLAVPENAAHIALNAAHFAALEAVNAPEKLYGALNAAADKFAGAVNLDELARHFGEERTPADMSDEEKKAHEVFVEQRKAISTVFCNVAKAAVAKDAAALASGDALAAEGSLADVRGALAQARRWAQPSEAGIKASVSLYVDVRDKKYGKVLKASTGALDAAVLAAALKAIEPETKAPLATLAALPSKRLNGLITAAVAQHFGWSNVVDLIARRTMVKYPYAPERYF
jgi:tripeptidyl-peptidase-2